MTTTSLSPTSLYASTVADGITLAKQLASEFQKSPPTDMAAHLRASALSEEMLAAQCFAVVAAANQHWGKK
jgi:hypothetical protein